MKGPRKDSSRFLAAGGGGVHVAKDDELIK